MPLFDPAHLVLAILAASLVLFLTDALRYELIALLVVLALIVTRCSTPQQAFAGFSSGAVILIGSMYVFGAAAGRWGISEWIGERLLAGAGASPDGVGSPERGEALLALRVTLVSGLLSTVLSDTAVVATLLPVVSSVARRRSVPVSRLLIPLSFGSLLGGTVSVIGTSTNIAINGVLERQGVEPFALFEFGHLGVVMLACGALYFLGPGRALLPRSRVDESLSEHYQIPKFLTEVLVEPTSTLINRAVAEAGLFERYGVTVLGIVRAEGGGTLLAPGPYNRIREDDVLIVQGEPEAIVRLREGQGLKQRETVQAEGRRLDSSDVLLVEAVVPAASSLVGRTVREAEFRTSTGLNVLGISKHGDVRATTTKNARLDIGDSILIQGHRRDVERVQRNRELLVLDEVGRRQIGGRAWTTIGLLLAVLVMAQLGFLTLPVAAFGGACLLVLLRCIRIDDALRAIDLSVLLLVGGMLALGEAFDRHQLGRAVAGWMAGLGDEAGSPRLMVALLIAGTALLTQLTANVSAAVIMTPVALSLASGFEVEPRGFLVAVLIGANLALMSPVGHQANMMVTGPGDYRYRDFLRVGTPLTLLLVVVGTVLIPVLWPLGL